VLSRVPGDSAGDGRGRGRSRYWEEVRTVVERTREHCRAPDGDHDPDRDPDRGEPAVPVEAGVGPVLRLYVRSRREGEPLSAVEESLLEGALNDWLARFAARHGTALDDRVTLHEAAMRYADTGSLRATCRDLAGVGTERPASG
jgi:hypothetical protein